MNFKQDQSKGKVNVMVNLNYYNSDVGFFEPAIDRFGVDVEIESVGKSKKIKLIIEPNRLHNKRPIIYFFIFC